MPAAGLTTPQRRALTRVHHNIIRWVDYNLCTWPVALRALFASFASLRRISSRPCAFHPEPPKRKQSRPRHFAVGFSTRQMIQVVLRDLYATARPSGYSGSRVLGVSVPLDIPNDIHHIQLLPRARTSSGLSRIVSFWCARPSR
ncbi:hypothetical protein EXIGLDRAFT_41208 [Exidia glandulosa HHB12029]|uniref:Uncharacterized protein n=1 Tax=Exidia glandulosa HHB12029 TaxID=1314781 RepID=A0A166MS35_EXIGL|nr:hypothetical protein EXIGLDRAFT_41208 [Exidia glandulosa HHB12029]